MILLKDARNMLTNLGCKFCIFLRALLVLVTVLTACVPAIKTMYYKSNICIATLVGFYTIIETYVFFQELDKCPYPLKEITYDTTYCVLFGCSTESTDIVRRSAL